MGVRTSARRRQAGVGRGRRSLEQRASGRPGLPRRRPPEEAWPARRVADAQVEAEVEVTFEVDVQAMLDSRAHTEELVRDLQHTLLNAADQDAPTEATEAVVRLALRLDSGERGDSQSPPPASPVHQRRQAPAHTDDTPSATSPQATRPWPAAGVATSYVTMARASISTGTSGRAKADNCFHSSAIAVVVGMAPPTRAPGGVAPATHRTSAGGCAVVTSFRRRPDGEQTSRHRAGASGRRAAAGAGRAA